MNIFSSSVPSVPSCLVVSCRHRRRPPLSVRPSCRPSGRRRPSSVRPSRLGERIWPLKPKSPPSKQTEITQGPKQGRHKKNTKQRKLPQAQRKSPQGKCKAKQISARIFKTTQISTSKTKQQTRNTESQPTNKGPQSSKSLIHLDIELTYY